MSKKFLCLSLLAVAHVANAGQGHQTPHAPSAVAAPVQAPAPSMQLMPAQNASSIKIITTADLKKHMAEKKLDVVIDARGKDNFEKEHVKGAINIPYDTAPAAISEALGKAVPGKAPKDVHVAVYCQSPSCPASAMLAKKLEEMGYGQVHELPAGIEGWIKDGGDVETSVAATGPVVGAPAVASMGQPQAMMPQQQAPMQQPAAPPMAPVAPAAVAPAAPPAPAAK